MKKICFLSDNNMDISGGEQRVVSNIINALADSYEIDFICKFNRELFYSVNSRVNIINIEKECPATKPASAFTKVGRWINFRTGLIEKIGNAELLNKIKYSDGLSSEWISFLNSREYDTIIGVSGYFGLFLISYGDSIKARKITWFHNTFEAYFKSPEKYNYGYEKLLHCFKNDDSNKLVVLTEKDRQVYKSMHGIEAVCIPNPLSFITEKKTDLSNKKMLFVGRIVKEQKGMDLLLNILDIVFDKENEWTIDIVGDGEDFEYLETEIKKKLWKNRVNIAGSTNDVNSFYQSSDILLLPSRWEGFGLVVTEAMECGLPVVSFDTYGPSEIITDNQDGFIIENYDINKFANRVLELINNKEKLYQFSCSAIKKAGKYSIENIAEYWIKEIECHESK